MSLNNKEIDLILRELELEGKFIQKIIQPSYTSLVFFLYDEKAVTLFISLEAGGCRLHSTENKIPKFDKPMRFMELLRSRIKGSKITRAEQLNEDRIVRLTLSGNTGSYFLYLRLWSGAANIILTDEKDNIIDAFYRRPKRGEISGGKFILPEKNKPEKKEYEVREYDKEKTFNSAIEDWYINNAPKISKEAVFAEAENLYGVKIEKLKHTILKLEKKREEFLNAETLKNTGDLLFANLHLLKKGMTFIELEDYTKNNLKVNINLDPLKTPKENAASYYEKYKKAVSGLTAVEQDIVSYKNQIKIIAEKLLKLKEEENPYIVQKIIQREKIPLQRKEKNEKAAPGLQFLCSGWTLLVGRTAAENDDLLRHFVKGSDLWLHTRDYAGGYVFIKAKPKKTVPLPVLIKAGNLAVFYSKARKNGGADLYTTQVKHLRRAKNAPKGTVLPTQERNLSIKLDEKILKELEEEKIIPS
ncbi:NFACT RNA binding domain-containing protein [Treponema pedis]|uniref:NFACT RNA binding domain-containing protein n=1 Tax=Treponema pedis TaxID=409322 RepID=UPI0004062123|nr:NFACT family protein [Treponema pedis]